MPLLTSSPDQVEVGLRVLKTALTVDGPLDETQRAIVAIAQQLHGTKFDFDALEPIDFELLRHAEADEARRKQFVQALVTIAVLRREASPAVAKAVARVAAELGVDEPAVAHLRQFAHHRLGILRFDFVRRSMPFNRSPESAKNLVDLARQIGHISGLTEDRALADRYRALAKLPAGTLGRALYDFYEAQGFPFPGEKHGAPEAVVRHDLSHVLGGYSTDMDGELAVVAFQAGYRREGAMSFFLFLAYQFQAGVKLTYIAPTAEASFSDEAGRARILHAYQRGAAMNVDLMDPSWDFWSEFPEQLVAVRDRHRVAAE